MGDYYRGHEITYSGEVWHYADGVRVVDDPQRACGACGLSDTSDGHDGCLGDLGAGVRNACCGHGRDEEAYVQLRTGHRIAGPDALAFASVTREARATDDGEAP